MDTVEWEQANINGHTVLYYNGINTYDWLVGEYYLVIFSFHTRKIATIHLASAIDHDSAVATANSIVNDVLERYPWYQVNDSAIVICKELKAKGTVINNVTEVDFSALLHKFKLILNTRGVLLA